MSPSRGSPPQEPPPHSPLDSSEAATQARATLLSSSALTSAKQNINYLIAPNSPNSPRPVHLRTRALLKSIRFISIFIFWRIVRYGKYALVGSLVAAVGATAFGGLVSGVGFLLAPPTLLTSLGIGAAWGVGKWGFRKMGVGQKVGVMGEMEKERAREGMRKDGEWRGVQGPGAVPW